MILTRQQREAVKKVYDRSIGATLPNVDEPEKGRLTYLQFRRKAIYAPFDDTVMIQFFGMWLGIETDGYTHS